MGQETNHGRLRDRQIRFLNLYQATGYDPSQKVNCAHLAGYKGPQAGYLATKAKTVRAILLEEMEKAGLSLGAIVSTHAQMLKANKEGKYRESVPDNFTRMRAVELGYEMMDAMPEKKHSVKSQSMNVHRFQIETLKRAEEATGESIIDADMVEEEELESPL